MKNNDKKNETLMKVNLDLHDVTEAMDDDPVLEKVFLLALALKNSMGKQAETEDNEDEDDNEEEE